MDRPYRHIEVERPGDVYCIRLRQPQLDEPSLYELCDELTRVIAEDGCRKMVLSLGPEEPRFLYSIFLAKLVTLQRRLRADNGGLKLCDVGPDTMNIFDVCGLARLFDFYPDKAAALTAFAS